MAATPLGAAPANPAENAPARWEFALLLLVLAALVWQFQGLRGGAADTERYRRDAALEAGPLPSVGPAALATLCHRVALPPRLRWRWEPACDGTRAEQAGAVDALPAALQAEHAALQQAIAAGAAQRLARIAPLARSLAEGVLPEADEARLAATSAELAAYRSGYAIGADAAAGSLTLACAWAEVQRPAASTSTGTGTGTSTSASATDVDTAVTLANQFALVRGAPARLAGAAGGAAPVWSAAASAECRALGPPQRVLTQAAELARQVREGPRLAAKAAAMQRLLQRAPWWLVGWSLLLWALLSLARRTRRPARYLPLALIAWAAAGAVSGLALPDAGTTVPAAVWAGLAGAGVLLGLVARTRWLERWALFAPCDTPRSVSFLSLPGFVGFVGLGWWLVLDLALNGHVQNRYLGLRHALAVFAAMFLLSVVPVLAPGLATGWVRWAGLITNALRPTAAGGARGWARPVGLWAVYAAVVLGFALLTPGWRQLTGELLPLWLLLGVAWFFLLRAARWGAPSGGGWRWLAGSLLPLAVHAAVVLAALLLTDDLGPVLVVLFASAIYAGAFAAQALLGRGARWPLAAGAGLLGAVLLAAGLLGGLYAFTQLPGGAAARVAERLASVVDPYSAENDQLAHVLWLGLHTPPEGHGLGSVPWCGTLPGAGCPGVPAQAQSDYSFAALQAVVGPGTALGLLAAWLLWLALPAVRLAAQSRGTLSLARPRAAQAAWLAWLGVCWAVLTIVQGLVTVAGNLGALPLTGVTWPFVSYGLWSLLRNTLVLGLVMHRPEIDS